MIFLPKRSLTLLTKHSIKVTALAGVFAQAGRPLVSLITLPLLLTYLGQDGIGIWMIALSLLGLIGFVNSGLTATVVTSVGRLGDDLEIDEIRALISAATLLAIIWGLIVLAVAVPFALFLDWKILLHLSGKVTSQDVSKLMIALAVMMAFGFVSSLPQQIMRGRMHGFLAHAVNFFGMLAGAAGLVVGIFLKAPLWMLGVAFLAPTIITSFIGGTVYLNRLQIQMFSPKNLRWHTLKWLGHDSLKMAGYQIAYAVSSQSDLLLIGVILGTSASAAYGIAHRVFSLPILFSTIVSQAQWPVMARWDATGDHSKVGKLLRNTTLIGIFSGGVVAVIMGLFYETLIKLWLGQYLVTDEWILVGMIAWVLTATLVNIYDGVLRARQETSFLMRCMFLMALINISASVILIPLIGAGGAIWGSVIGYMTALLVPYSVRLWRLYGKHHK